MAEVMVIGSGGREQAIKQAVEASKEVGRVVVSSNVSDGLKEFSGRKEKPLVIFGPEGPVIEGQADDLRDEGYLVLGASQQAAQYEASSSRATKMAQKAGVIQPDTFIAEGDWMPPAARAYVEGRNPHTYVIRPDGLSDGRGIVMPFSKQEARHAVEGMISGVLFKGAGSEIINFQDRLIGGTEILASAIVGAGKDDFVVLPIAQVNRRLFGGDESPNTGGLGAYAPVPKQIINEKQIDIIRSIVQRSLEGMAAEGVTYERAVISMSLLLSDNGMGEPALMAYYTRFGATAPQVMLPLLKSAGVDAYSLFRSAAEGKIEHTGINLADIGQAAVTVCLAAEGYPVSPRKGDVIYGLDRTYDGVGIQLADVTTNGHGQIVTTEGGRAVYVTGQDETINKARARAYAAIGEKAIHFAGFQYRKDIGQLPGRY
jgi:phosphoribosylamine--glycine ligase